MAEPTVKRTLGAFADQQAGEVYAENEGIARKNRVLTAELKAAEEKVAAATAQADALQSQLDLYAHQYNDRPDWLTGLKKPTASEATLLGLLSDLHTGEVVKLGELNGYNRYDMRIADLRLKRFFTKSIELAQSWTTCKYNGAVLALLGDLVSGDVLHDELVTTNEASTPQVVLWLVPRLSEGIELWRKAFGKVHVPSAPGNHGRDSKIPRYKGRSAHNFDTLIASLVAREFSHVDGVTFEIPESLDANFTLHGLAFSAEHGEELARNFNGSAEIGVLGPMVRGTGRKKNAYAVEGKALDIALWGHFHQLKPVPSGGFIANGSVKGYDEFARGLKLRPEPPQQALMAVVPEYGITINAPVLVQDRKAERW